MRPGQRKAEANGYFQLQTINIKIHQYRISLQRTINHQEQKHKRNKIVHPKSPTVSVFISCFAQPRIQFTHCPLANKSAALAWQRGRASFITFEEITTGHEFRGHFILSLQRPLAQFFPRMNTWGGQAFKRKRKKTPIPRES